MYIIVILFCALICCIGIYCKIFFEKDNIKTFILKIIAASIFLSIGVYSLIKNNNFDTTQILILGGLVFCTIGDIIIGLRRLYPNKRELFMMLGLSFFLLAHLAYSTSFSINLVDMHFYALCLVVILWLGFALLLKYTKIEFGKFIIPCYLYILTASIMFSVALFGLINEIKGSTINLFVGILSFIISDVFLAYTYFKKTLQHPRLIKCISVITYFLGQGLIAFSIFLY